MSIGSFDELIQKVKNQKEKKRLAVVAAHDEHTLEAVEMAVKHGIADPILIGDGDKIRELISRYGWELSQVPIHEEKDDRQAAKKSISMICNGEANFIMKGKLQTADLLKEVVNKETGLQKGRVMSHVAILELPSYPKLLVITDGGMLPYPNLSEKEQILLNAVDLLRSLGYHQPKAAVLAAAETVNAKLPESIDGAELKKRNQEGHLLGCLVEGPISYDLMISEESAKVKGYESQLTGDTDILLMPNMACGNILSKALIYSAGAKMAGVIAGAAVPIVLVSRGASAEEKYLSLVLAAASA